MEKEDEKAKKELAEGKITQQQYDRWKLSSTLTGQRYKDMQAKLAERVTKANEIATAYINGDMAKIYALNHSYTTQSIIRQGGDILKGVDFALINEEAVKRLIKENPDLMPYYPKEKAVKRGIDLAYGKKQITATIRSALIRGLSVPDTAKELMSKLKTMGRASAIRAARTAFTEAENAGRQAAADELAKKGVILQKEWIATKGKRTREWHAEADGQKVDNDKPFKVKNYKGQVELLMRPGDKSFGATGSNLYNCRCGSGTVVVGFKSTLTKEQKEKAKIRRDS